MVINEGTKKYQIIIKTTFFTVYWEDVTQLTGNASVALAVFCVCVINWDRKSKKKCFPLENNIRTREMLLYHHHLGGSLFVQSLNMGNQKSILKVGERVSNFKMS